jgi:hypothetical protein
VSDVLRVADVNHDEDTCRVVGLVEDESHGKKTEQGNEDATSSSE